MSPRKFLDDDHKQPAKSGVVINGPRPTPLKLKQESHTIHKHQQHKQIRPPIIIYTHSPEVIHTKPHEFMALVQKLTGAHPRSSSRDHQDREQQEIKKRLKQVDDQYNNRNDHKEVSNDSTNVTHDEKDKIMKLAKSSISSSSPMFNPPSNPYVNDIPLFTPNASDYFCSPHRRFYGFSDVVSSSPNLNTSLLSPAGGSILEIFKGLPEY